MSIEKARGILAVFKDPLTIEEQRHVAWQFCQEYGDKLLAVVEAAEAVLDEADPRKYGDMTAKQSDLADKLIALHENSATE